MISKKKPLDRIRLCIIRNNHISIPKYIKYLPLTEKKNKKKYGIAIIIRKFILISNSRIYNYKQKSILSGKLFFSLKFKLKIILITFLINKIIYNFCGFVRI